VLHIADLFENKLSLAHRGVDAVFEELQRIFQQCELPEMARFINLRDAVFDVVRSVLKRCLEPTTQMILNLIQIELAYINTNHPDFIGGSNAIQTSLTHGAMNGMNGMNGQLAAINSANMNGSASHLNAAAYAAGGGGLGGVGPGGALGGPLSGGIQCLPPGGGPLTGKLGGPGSRGPSVIGSDGRSSVEVVRGFDDK
jgi:hypothetical protein